MLEDILTMIWKELKEILQGTSKSKSAGLSRMLLPVALAGVLLPARMGGEYLTGPGPLFGLAWILPMVGIGLTVDSFAGERERHTLETLLASRLSDKAILLGKVSASVLYAWGLMMGSLILAVFTVNVTHPTGTLQMFPAKNAVGLLVFGLLTAVLVCSASVLVSLRASTVRQASQNLGFGLMAVYVGAIFGFQALSRPHRVLLMQAIVGNHLVRTVLVALAVLVTLNVALLSAAKTRFKRARLILD